MLTVNFYKFVLTICPWLILGACALNKNVEEHTLVKPNILLIVSEDNGADLGCYGNKEVKTPVLDKLADEGVLFENAYVTYSVCSPSRGTIFTGLYPHQNGQIGLATHKYRMYKSFKTLPVYMKEAGYRTGCLGKIHVNPESAIPFDFHPIKSANFAKKKLSDYAEEASKFMNASDDPFFMMVNFPDAHFPVQKQVEGMPVNPIDGTDVKGALPYVGADSERLREYTANYYNCMARLDESVGQLLQKLKESGKAENTLIVYLGDHGAQFSRGKCSNYEGGLKVPFIIKWPENSDKNIRRKELISSIDIVPTLIEVAGADIPKELPGLSLLPLLKNENAKWRKYVYADGLGSALHFYYPRRSVRGERYKLINNLLRDRENPKVDFYATHLNGHFDGGTEYEEINNSNDIVKRAYKTWLNPPEFELYDLRNDPWEFNDLSDKIEYSGILNKLKHQLKNWQIETKDPLADSIQFTKLTEEIETIKKKSGVNGYAKNKDFSWQYPEYFSNYISNSGRDN